MEPIPQEWIKKYVDQLLKAAQSFGDTPMGNAALERADHIMDMVKAFRDKTTEGAKAAERLKKYADSLRKEIKLKDSTTLLDEETAEFRKLLELRKVYDEQKKKPL